MTEANSYICRTCLTHTQKDDCKSLQSDEEVKPFATIREMLTDVISNIVRCFVDLSSFFYTALF